MRTVTTQLPDDLAADLDKLAETDGRTRSWLIREALTDYLSQRREVERLTVEGIEAMRRGELVDHDQVSGELDAWGS